MPERKSTPIEMVVATTEEIQGAIERIAREGAKKLLQAALEAEVEEHLSRYEHIKDAEGHRLVVRNGHAPRRLILTGVGAVAVRRPRIDEREVCISSSGNPQKDRAKIPISWWGFLPGPSDA